jgi:hypothetical protein
MIPALSEYSELEGVGHRKTSSNFKKIPPGNFYGIRFALIFTVYEKRKGNPWT